MKFKDFFSLILIFYLLNFSLVFSSGFFPSTSNESEKFSFDYFKKSSDYFVKTLDRILENSKNVWNFFYSHFFQKIYFSVKKELEKRKPIVKKEFEKEKLETEKEFKKWLGSVLNTIQIELKKK